MDIETLSPLITDCGSCDVGISQTLLMVCAKVFLGLGSVSGQSGFGVGFKGS